MNKKLHYLLMCFVFAFGYSVQAQETQVKSTLHTKAAYMKTIPAFSQMDNIIAAEGLGHVAPPKRRGSNTVVPGKGLPQGPDPLASAQRSAQTREGRAPLTDFAAHQGTVLNDPTGAIGPNHYVYAFNSGFGIKDRNGNTLLAEASLATIFPNETLGDPVVVYDNYADRFIIMEFSDTPNGILIAVGQGPDPVNDGWYTYRFNTGTFPDYEKLSIWADGYYITSNKDSGSDTAETVFAVERDEMLVGNPNAQFIGFPLPTIDQNGFFSPGGFNATGASLPPVGTPAPIVYLQDDAWSGVSQDELKIWNITTNWANPTSSSISNPQVIPTSPFDAVFDNGSFRNLDEPGSGPDIDAIQATMMYMTNYRRFGTHNSVVMNHVIDVDGNDSRAGIRWYELRQTADGQPWSIYQEGTYSQPNYSTFCASINMDVDGNIGLAYTIVSSSIYTSLRYTGRLATDPLGTMTVAEQTIVDGDSKTNRTDGRYGDYSQLTIDPLDDKTFWHIAEYMKGPSNVRKSHVAAFQIAPPVADNEAPTAPTSLAANGTTATATNLSWNAATDNIGVTAYDVYQNGTLVSTVANTNYAVTGLSPNTTYNFYVIAKDAAGNASPQSNTASVTTADISSCTGGISSFPYNESYETNLGDWTQETSDDINWTRDSGGTPSRRTGPSSGAQGAWYMFVEASGTQGYPNKQAILNSPCYDLSAATDATFTFGYHMYGASDMGTFLLEASNDNGATWVTLWSQTGNQGNQWNTQAVDLAAYIGGGVQLRFNRTTGSTWQADIAIDNISLTAGGGNTGGGDCADADLTLTITLDNYPEETAWSVTSGGSTVASNSYSTANPDGSTVVETISGLSDGDYTFTITDSFGDGICCSYGNGSYTLESANGEIVSGGSFTNSESTDFCVASSRLNTYPLSNGNDAIDFKVFPNPAKDILNISVGDTNITGNVQVFNAFGMLVNQIDGLTEKGSIDVSNYATGAYFVRFTSGNNIVTKKFIKQ